MRLTILFALAFVACKKKPSPTPTPTPAPTASTPCTPPSGIKDTPWKHSTGTLATLKFRSDGKYFQNADSSGTWSFHGCDSVYVQRPSNNFYYRVKSVTTDTLWLNNPTFGEVKYYK